MTKAFLRGTPSWAREGASDSQPTAVATVRKGEQGQMEIASVELPSPLSSDCSVFLTAFGPCKAGTSDLITQQLYLTTLSLSL